LTDRNLICIGAIAGSFGVHGELRLKSFCADPASIGAYGPLSNEDGSKQFALKIARPVKTGFAARVEGVETREQADALKGQRLYADRSILPSLPDDEFYHADLVDLEVYDTGGVRIGKISAILDHGAGVLLEIQAPDLKSSVLMPFTQAAVPTVDLTLGRVVVDPPAGIMPDSSSDTGA
jgi:16S rRNA processing protein RimM